jgi:hypothetical protein
LEIVNGASPTNATSRILRGLQPEVQFVQTTSRTIEGVGTHSVPFQFKSNYTGKVYYSLSVMSTATNGADFTHPLNGMVEVQGGAGVIPLNLISGLSPRTTTPKCFQNLPCPLRQNENCWVQTSR